MVSCTAVVAVISAVLQSLVLAQLTGSVVLVGVTRGDGLVVTLGVVGELAVGRLMSNWLAGHGLLEVNWGAVMSVMDDSLVVHGGGVVDSLVDDWLVVDDGLVVDNGHDVVHDSLMNLSLVVWSGLVVHWGVVMDGLLVVGGGLVVDGLLVRADIAVVVAVGAFVVADLVVNVRGLVVSVVWLVVHLVVVLDDVMLGSLVVDAVRLVILVLVGSVVASLIVGTVVVALVTVAGVVTIVLVSIAVMRLTVVL